MRKNERKAGSLENLPYCRMDEDDEGRKSTRIIFIISVNEICPTR